MAVLLAASICVACGSGGGGQPAGPDFTLAVSPATITAVEGSSSGPATVSITALNGFTGSVAVEIAGLPNGATVSPAPPLVVSANAPQQFTVTTSDSTPTGTVTLALHATSGMLAHDVTARLTTSPVIQTWSSGSVLYLQSHANGHTARIGLQTIWGGAIVEVSMDGTNFVNAHDTGREVQPALYDGAAQYPSGPVTTFFGWDPVLGGDYYDHGSPVSSQVVAPDSLYTRAVPVQWFPDSFGGGPTMAVPTDMLFEQMVTVDPIAPLAFKVHFKLTHNGADTHYNAVQEFPAVYVNSAYSTLAYYTGTSPWTSGALTETVPPVNGSPLDSIQVYAPEYWAALVDANGQGLSVFAPAQYPSVVATSYPGSGGSGPQGDATVYMRPFASFSVAPRAVIESDVYLVPGDARAARAAIYALHAALAPADAVAPIVTVDTPVAGAPVSGSSVNVAGWAFDNVAVQAVHVYVDGILAGTATLGIARPDVAAAFPNLAPVDCGWSFSFDSTRIASGNHALTVRVVDTSLNEALLPPIPIVVGN
jgi:hypothetical protein